MFLLRAQAVAARAARGEIMRDPSARPRLKVPAPQADGVAARLCPPREMTMMFKRAGTLAGGAGPGRRCAGGGLGPARTLL